MRISKKSTLIILVLLFVTEVSFSVIAAQNVESKSAQSEATEIDLGDAIPENEFTSRASREYVRKFSNMSENSGVKERELKSLQSRMEAVKIRAKKVDSSDGKALFKENIKTLKLSEKQLRSELKLLKKGVRLLQENKDEPEAKKREVLFEISKIENKIRSLKSDLDSKKNDVILEGIAVDDIDVYQNPPKAECNVIFDGIDTTTKKPRKEVESEFLFGYTNPKLKGFFKEKDFLTCDSKILSLDKKSFLWLNITIASKDAVKTYGKIEQRSTLKFELLSGEILYLQNAQNTIGELEAYSGNTTYQIILPLSKSQLKQLSKGEVDRIGIMWTSGYEQYEVYNVDLIMNQIQCLEEN